jgi:hypothetical protein
LIENQKQAINRGTKMNYMLMAIKFLKIFLIIINKRYKFLNLPNYLTNS